MTGINMSGEDFARINRRVALSLQDVNVSAGFRDAVFDAAKRFGMTQTQFILEAAGEWLKACGYEFIDTFPVTPDGQQPAGHVYPYRFFTDENGARLVDENCAVLATLDKGAG